MLPNVQYADSILYGTRSACALWPGEQGATV
jgi:hypothetical protein